MVAQQAFNLSGAGSTPATPGNVINMKTNSDVDKKEIDLRFYHPTYITFGPQKCLNCKKETIYPDRQVVVNCIEIGMFCGNTCLLDFVKNRLDEINKEITIHESMSGPIMDIDIHGNEIEETKESYISGSCLVSDRDYKNTLEKVLKYIGIRQ